MEANGEYINFGEFDALFDEYYGRLNRRFWKVEVLQRYAEPGNSAFEALAHGDWDTASREARLSAEGSRDRYAGLRSRGVSIRRLRWATLPLTSYTRLELEIYLVLQDLGAEIAVQVPQKHHDQPDFQQDCLIFDDQLVLVQEYLAGGVLAGGWAVRDTAQVQRIADKFARSFENAIPVHQFYDQEVRAAPRLIGDRATEDN